MGERYSEVVSVGLAVVVAVAVAGCERDGEKPEEDVAGASERGTSVSQPEFAWDDALGLTSSQTRNQVDDLAGCDPDKHLPALSPETSGYFPEGSRRCRVSHSAEAEEGAYRVDEILYDRKAPTAVLLRPAESTPLSTSIIPDYRLPALPVVRRRLVDWDGRRRVISLRQDIIHNSADPTEAVAIDIVSRVEQPEVVDFVRVASTSSWPYSLEHVQLRGPALAGESLIAPRTSADGQLGPSISVEVGLDRVTIQPQPVYPIRRNGDDPEFTPLRFDRELLDDSADTEAQAWRAEAQELVRKWVRNQRDLGKDSVPVPFEIVATRTLPFDRLVDLMDRVDGPLGARFYLAGRGGEPLDADFSEFTRRGDRFVRLVTEGDIAAPADGEEPPIEALDIRVTPRGFRLTAGGEELAPVDGCPDEGPTVCLRRDEQIVERAEACRERQREEDFAAAERVYRRMLTAYDWEGLAGAVRDWKAEHAEVSTVRVGGAAEVPYGLAHRVLETVRWQTGEEGERVGLFEDLALDARD
jgi:hypothetical protein